MKMFVFPGDETRSPQEMLNDRPLVSHAFDAALARFGLVLMAWASGACAAVLLAHIG